MAVGFKIFPSQRPAALLSLIVANLIIFIIVRIVAMVSAPELPIEFLSLPSLATKALTHPWTLVTYMFTQYDVLHILFNMLALYWFGSLLSLRFTQRRVLTLYFIGGLAGAAFYLGGAALFARLSGELLGSSAAVMAIMVTAAVMMPDYEIGLLLIGNVKLKWVAVATLVIFAIGLTGNNAGGHVAHLGGMLAGLIYGLAYRNRERRQIEANIRRKEVRTDMQNLDALLDKVKRSGYSSLTSREKEMLTAISGRIDSKRNN